MQIRTVASDDELRHVAAIRAAAARPGESASPAEALRDQLAVAPELRFLLALDDGEAVGCGSAGSYVPGEPGEHAPADATVLPEHRGRGVGTAILRAASEHARSLGKTGLTLEVREDEREALAFLQRRGYEVVERQKAVALDLTALEPPAPTTPPGVEIVTRRDDLVRGMYEVALEAGRDIPGLDAEHQPTFEEWGAFELKPSRDPRAAFVALVDGEVAGFAQIDVVGETGYHGLTAVRRADRRRGIGRALKLHQIAAAKELGLATLITESEERNEPMRSLNASLGYRSIPGSIVVQGPLFDRPDMQTAPPLR